MEAKLLERLLRSFIKDEFTGCWNWNRRLSHHGYGRFVIQVIEDIAHRAVYKAIKGNIPEGLHLDHLCRNRKCVNPDHLEPVTNQENVRRGGRAVNVKNCKRGHPRTEENTLYKKDGKKVCKLCQRLHVKNYEEKMKKRAIHEW